MHEDVWYSKKVKYIKRGLGIKLVEPSELWFWCTGYTTVDWNKSYLHHTVL